MSREVPSNAASHSKPIKIAILAMGGEGGGVLADWIVDAAETQGYHALSTSVPGVAQRTGATIYYVEVLPIAREAQRSPVFSLMPTPGDVDVVIASELMESARAVQRGLVTPDKTTLITSSHRVYAMPEKMAMGDGRVSTEQLLEAGRKAARKYVVREFSRLAERNGSVISAVLFGALAAADVLPWGRKECESAIERGGVGVAASFKAFAAGFDAYRDDVAQDPPPAERPRALEDPRLQDLLHRVRRHFPADIADVVAHGVKRAADYQDLAYAAEYLDRLAPMVELDKQLGVPGWRLARETARYLALWMTFEDTSRVAELKLRASRFQRVGREVQVGQQQLMHINEYFHPRLQEIADMLPEGVGRWLMSSGIPRALVERFTQGGRVIRTTSLTGFLMLYLVAGCRGFRRGSLRYARESQAMRIWIARAARTAPTDYALACEIVECQRLIKGYGDTHARGMSNYETIMSMLEGRTRATAEQVRELRDAALADESGQKLARALEAQASANVAEVSA